MTTQSDAGLRAAFVLDPQPIDDHASLIQEAIDLCSGRGGGVVFLRAGEYRSGTVVLRSGVTLHLEKDARLLANVDIGFYAVKEGMPTALVLGDGAENIGLAGEGIIDGNGRAFRSKNPNPPAWAEERKATGTWIPAFEVRSRPRPLSLIHLANCRNVRMDRLRVEDSPRWTIHCVGCQGLVIRNLTVRSSVDSSNGDGIDIDGCMDVLVEDCDIETGDDAICLKSSRSWGLDLPCRNVTIRRCRAYSTTHGFCIGHDTQDNFEDIVVDDVRMGGWGGQRCLTGIGIGSVDGAAIRGVRLSNIVMTDVVAPFQIRLSSEGKSFRGHTPMAAYRDKKLKQRPTGELRDISLENITVRGATGNSFISGLPGHALRDVRFRNVNVECVEKIDPAEALHTVDELESEYPQSRMWRYLPAHGLFLRHIAGLELYDVTLTPAAGDTRPALLMADVSGLSSRAVTAG